MLQTKCLYPSHPHPHLSNVRSGEAACNNFLKAAITKARPLHTLNFQLCRGEKVGRVWTCFQALFIHFSQLLLSLFASTTRRNTVNELKKWLSESVRGYPNLYDSLHLAPIWQPALHPAFRCGRFEKAINTSDAAGQHIRASSFWAYWHL